MVRMGMIRIRVEVEIRVFVTFRSLSSCVLNLSAAGSVKENLFSRVSTLIRAEVSADGSSASGAAVEYLPLFGFVRRRRAAAPLAESSTAAATNTKIVCG